MGRGYRSVTRSPRRAIAAGEKIVKYGAPIGSATAAIARGRARAHAQYAKRLSADFAARRPGALFAEPTATMNGYLRTDGRKGIRNITVVVYLVECAHHVAREIVVPFPRPGRASARLSRLLSECLRPPDAAAALHASQRRRGAARLARLRRLQSRANCSRKSAPPAGRRTCSSSRKPAARAARSRKAARGSPARWSRSRRTPRVPI